MPRNTTTAASPYRIAVPHFGDSFQVADMAPLQMPDITAIRDHYMTIDGGELTISGGAGSGGGTLPTLESREEVIKISQHYQQEIALVTEKLEGIRQSRDEYRSQVRSYNQTIRELEVRLIKLKLEEEKHLRNA